MCEPGEAQTPDLYFELLRPIHQADDAQRSFLVALRSANERGLIPVELITLTGLAALETYQQGSQRTLELVLYILQHPACAQETKSWPTQLQLELESKLSHAEIEVAQKNIDTKSLEEFTYPLLASV